MMKETRVFMDTPITVEIADAHAEQSAIDKIFDYFKYIDAKFSVYKETSEIARINRGEIKAKDYSEDIKEIFRLSEETKRATNGYFDIVAPDGKIDPSGLVKGWSIYQAARLLSSDGFKEFYIEAGGDIEARGKYWKIGVKNPFNQKEIIKVLRLKNLGVATSGTYIRGEHIYNPHNVGRPANEIISLTVIGPNVYEADRFATAAFAMGRRGIAFVDKLKGFEGYMIDHDGIATMTSDFEKYTIKSTA